MNKLIVCLGVAGLTLATLVFVVTLIEQCPIIGIILWLLVHLIGALMTAGLLVAFGMMLPDAMMEYERSKRR